jgi:carbon monoxide dehydrogenase subunit G
MDIPRIARCMPGAELTEVVDAQNYRGKISVRLGPVSLAFAGRVQIDGLDEANHSAQVKAQGNDAKGRGSANATARFHIEPIGEGSRVMIHTNLMLSGAVAQYGRGVGIIQGTAAQIVGQFAANLRKQLAQEPPLQPAAAPAVVLGAPASVAEQADPAAAPRAPAAPAAAPARPISGLTLITRVIWQQIRVLFGGRPS